MALCALRLYVSWRLGVRKQMALVVYILRRNTGYRWNSLRLRVWQAPFSSTYLLLHRVSARKNTVNKISGLSTKRPHRSPTSPLQTLRTPTAAQSHFFHISGYGRPVQTAASVPLHCRKTGPLRHPKRPLKPAPAAPRLRSVPKSGGAPASLECHRAHVQGHGSRSRYRTARRDNRTNP